MNLDSVRAIKAQASDEERQRILNYASDPVSALSLLDASEPPMPPGVALGVGRRDNGEHVLVVRTDDPAKGEAFSAAAAGESDVRIITVTKRTTPAYLQSRVRPLEPGQQVRMAGKPFVGTLGGFVRDARALYVLSNSHVLADEGTAAPGHRFGQPHDNPTHLVGLLDRFVPFNRSAPNLVDAALGRLDKTTAQLGFNGAIGGQLRGARAVTPDDLGRPVRKAGRTTGARAGKITAVEVDGLPVGYTLGTLRFNDQVEVSGGPSTDFSAGGDSGSWIVTEDGWFVALLFAGGRDSTGEDRTYGNRATNVLAALGVEVAA